MLPLARQGHAEDWQALENSCWPPPVDLLCPRSIKNIVPEVGRKVKSNFHCSGFIWYSA